jgi:GTP-binding protein Era
MGMTESKKKFKAGFVALIGEPNAGKSTLMNALLEEKVSIVSAKPQTTRNRITGILNLPSAQIAFVDAPGTLKSTTGINKYLQEEVSDVLDGADVICLLLSAEQNEESAKELIGKVQKAGKPWLCFVTKADLLGGTRTPKFFKLLLDENIPFVSVSTLKRKREARIELLEKIVPLLPFSAGPLFDEEIYTTQTMRQIAAELVRESCFEHLRQEIPYGLAVRVEEYNEEGPITRIRANLLIDKENHKAIVIGAKGQTLKKIGTEARKEIEKVVGHQIFLELHVEVKKDWTKNPRVMKELGYVVGKN